MLMVEISKLESRAEVEISKLKVEIRRLKQRGYERKYRAKLKAKNQKLKRMLTNANQEQAARKVETKKPRTVDYPMKTLLAPDIAALTPAEVREFWRQTVSAERSL